MDKRNSRLKKRLDVLLIFPILIVIASCYQSPPARTTSAPEVASELPQPTYTLPPIVTPSSHPVTATSTNTPLILPAPTAITSTPVEKPDFNTGLQLTFISDTLWGVYMTRVGCLQAETPCFSEPQMLFELPTHIFSISWSPDGQKVAFDTVGSGEPASIDVFVADWDGHNRVNITDSPIQEQHPVWSPDGKFIGYTACSGRCHAFAYDVSTKKRIELLALAKVDLKRLAGWSNNGKQLLFEAYDDRGISQVFLANLDGSGLSQVTKSATDTYYPSLSPDGSWVLYTKENKLDTSGESNLFIIRTDGTGDHNLTQDAVKFVLGSAWAPDGGWIAFSGGQDFGAYDIYLIKQDGTHLQNIIPGDYNDISPAWRMVSSN